MRLLDDAPHRLAEVGHEAHQHVHVEVAAAVGVEQRRVAVLVEAVR